MFSLCYVAIIVYSLVGGCTYDLCVMFWGGILQYQCVALVTEDSVPPSPLFLSCGSTHSLLWEYPLSLQSML